MVGISGVGVPQGLISGQIDRMQAERTAQPAAPKAEESSPTPPPKESERGTKVDVVA